MYPKKCHVFFEWPLMQYYRKIGYEKLADFFNRSNYSMKKSFKRISNF